MNLSPNNKLLALGSNDSTIKIYEIEDEINISKEENENEIVSGS